MAGILPIPSAKLMQHPSTMQPAPRAFAAPSSGRQAFRRLPQPVLATGGSLEASFRDESGAGKAGAASLDASSRQAAAGSAARQLPPQPDLPQLPPASPSSQEPQGRSTSTTTFSAAAPDPQRVLHETAGFLERELKRLFTTGSVTASRYTEDVTFQDPVARLKGRDAYIANIKLLRGAFDIDFVTHRLEEQEPAQILTRWTMVLKPKFVPWRPSIVVTGRSEYAVNTATGQIQAHRDFWDGIDDNSYLSLEGLAYVIRSLTSVQQTPKLESPKYTVLRKTGDYEIRRYEAYMVAEVDMPAGSSPAAGDGFNDLAGYIFGGNSRGSNMEMTTPVFTNAGQSGARANRMAFVMEERYGQDALPTPNNSRVERRLEEPKTVAARQFGGLPLDWEVRAAERQLRGSLLLDGFQPDDGYFLARYNDPFTLPAFRRNEVLIRLPDGFEP